MMNMAGNSFVVNGLKNSNYFHYMMMSRDCFSNQNVFAIWLSEGRVISSALQFWNKNNISNKLIKKFLFKIIMMIWCYFCFTFRKYNDLKHWKYLMNDWMIYYVMQGSQTQNHIRAALIRKISPRAAVWSKNGSAGRVIENKIKRCSKL